MSEQLAPLGVRDVHEFEGCRTLSYQCNGHVDVERFLRELTWEHEVIAPAGKVRAVWQHFIPVQGAADSGYLLERWAGGRGWKPVTVVDASDCVGR